MYVCGAYDESVYTALHGKDETVFTVEKIRSKSAIELGV